jgi:hypothetical protein
MPDAHQVCLESVLDARITELAAGQAALLREWILPLLASPQHHVSGAQKATDLVADRLQAVRHETGESARGLTEKLRALRETLRADKHAGRRWLRRRGPPWRRRAAADRELARYFHLRIEELTLNAVCRLAGLIFGQVAVLGDKLRNLAADLHRLADDFQTLPPAHGDGRATGGADSTQRVVAEAINSAKVELIEEMEHALEKQRWKLALPEETKAAHVLPDVLRRTARAVIYRSLKQMTVQEGAAGSDGKPRNSILSLSDALQAATPPLPRCGGAKRLLLVAPDELLARELVEQLGSQFSPMPTVIIDAENDVLLCYEMDQLPLRLVAAAVLDRRFQNVEIAARLHTRIDVSWSAL